MHTFLDKFTLMYFLVLGLVSMLCLTSCDLTDPEPPNNLLVNVRNNRMLLHSGASNILTIGNTSKGVIAWQASSATPWLRLEPSKGTILPNSFITIEVRAGAASQGEEGRIDVNSDVGAYRLTVEIAANSCINSQTARPASAPTPSLTAPKTTADNFVGMHAALEPYVPNQLIIRYEDGYDSSTVISSQSLQAYDVRILQAATTDTPALVEIGNMMAVQRHYASEARGIGNAMRALPALEQLAAELSQAPHIRYAEPNHYLYTQALSVSQITSDPLYGRQWYLKDFGLEQAWGFTTGSPAVTVAVIDSGVDTNHEDLRGRLLKGCDIFDKDDDVNPLKSNVHGTHVTGIVVATGGNGKGVVGVAPEGVRLLPIKVFNDSGSATKAKFVADAIRWAAGLEVEGLHLNPYPAQIINLSLGGPKSNKALNEAVEQVRRQGVLVIAASGNASSKDGIFTPSNAPYALAVGSVDGTRRRSCFSNYNSDKNKRSVDIVAPGGGSRGIDARLCNLRGVKGEAILNTFPMNSPQGNYGRTIGTSMATPFVSGVAALILSQEPFLTADSLHARLLNSTLRDMPEYNRAEYGTGILCADRALGAATLCGKTTPSR